MIWSNCIGPSTHRRMRPLLCIPVAADTLTVIVPAARMSCSSGPSTRLTTLCTYTRVLPSACLDSDFERSSGSGAS